MDALEIREKLRNIVFTNPLIDSIYLYRYSEGIILTLDDRVAFERFPDREFLADSQKNSLLYFWTGRRTVTNHNFSTNEEVQIPIISLSRKVPALSGGQGLIVVNIRIAALEKLLTAVPNPGLSYANLFDEHGSLLASTMPAFGTNMQAPHLEKEWLHLTFGYTA